ncbi:MlaD family protein [Nocardioides sp. NPDC058538]|uniref:MlaD family protein n=1 Tax=Nocardioides sp. NPDC058538 TaxID=3346542 RepID=UPI0036522DCF
MLLTRLVKRQLGVFACLTALALGLMVFTYARVPAMLGIGVYQVTAEFNDASGLYESALVTYRGVKVGQVTDLEVTPRAAIATLRLDNGTRIPGNVDAELHSTSAVGEQYVSLVSGSATRAALNGGDVLPPSRTVDMPQIAPVLDAVNRLLESVPQQQTRNVLDQVDTGLGSSSEDVGRLIEDSSTLMDTAQQEVTSTTELIRALEPVLATQDEMAPRTVSSMSSLRALTRELAANDADLRSLLRDGRTGLDSTTATVDDLQTTLPMLLDNLMVNGEVLNTYLPQLQQTLVVYPATIGRLQQTVNPRAKEGDVQLDLRAGVNDPPSCTEGYLSTDDRRSPSEEDVRKADPLAHCKTAPSDPSSVRGARNQPCPNSSARGHLPSSCGLEFGKGRWPEGADPNAASTAPKASAGEPPSKGTTDASAEDNSWKQLFLEPVGLW